MAAQFWGGGSDIFTMRSRFPVSTRGWTLQTLMRNAEVSGLRSRALRIEIVDIKQLKLPAILHWDMKHFVVLAEVKKRKLLIHDPATGKRWITWNDLDRSFSGVALELWPSEEFRPEKALARRPWREIIGRPRGLASLFAKLISFGLALQLISILLPMVSQWGIDNVATASDLDLLLLISAAMSILLASQVLMSAARSWFLTRLTNEFVLRWKLDVFSRLVSLPVNYFYSRKTGDITSRFDSIERIVNILNDNISESILDGIFGVFTLSIMLYYNVYLALIAVGGSLIYVALRVVRAGRLRELTQQNMAADAKEYSTLIETVRGIRVLKLFSQEETREQSWLSAAIEEANTNLFLSQSRILFKTASSLIGGVEQVLTFWLSLYLVSNSALTIGMVVAFFAYRQQFYGSVTSLTDNILDLYIVRVHAERVADITLSEPEVLRVNGAERAGELSGSIAMRDVSFRYGPHERAILEGLSLTINEGESVAIAGPSGCGKSTILNLICGFFTPTQGVISIGGVDSVALGLNTVRRQIAAVMQDDVLFSGTISTNIAAFSGEIDMARVMRCAKIAAIHDDILAMPMGYNTVVGDTGSTLSGGERQRICLARALYRKPKILVLDEATSHLDLAREARVNEGIKALGITRIIVAHRVETLCSADRIVILRDGKIWVETAPDVERQELVDLLDAN
ncbi:peptidase domain-containing ABC transporter [Rhizobium rhizogenes]|nr:peptidase domain-containing ABC transporter [Rhizobium rhizogenes]